MLPKLTLRQFFRDTNTKLLWEVRQFFRVTKPLWELGLGGVLAVFLLEAAIHLQWIATNITGYVLIIIILAAVLGFI
jgi:hypothetical protein